jgi:uncharacterized protein YbaA (DUF1428 family)
VAAAAAVAAGAEPRFASRQRRIARHRFHCSGGKAMHYVDGFVLAVPQDRLAEYRKMARLGARVWKEHGALDYVECVADDVKPGKHTSFPQAVKLKDGEVVVFSWIVYRNRRERDRINKLVMADPRLAKFMDPKNMPFDGKRMFWGGFRQMIAL